MIISFSEAMKEKFKERGEDKAEKKSLKVKRRKGRKLWTRKVYSEKEWEKV